MTEPRFSSQLLVLVALVIGVTACTRPQPRIESPAGLIQAMHDRYNGRWYETLTFMQETVRRFDGVTDTSTWYEALSIPGKLRIDIAPVDSGNGLLFVDDHRYVFQQGKLIFDRDEIHPLLLLGFDVYVSPPSETVAKLDSAGINMGIIREAVWKNRPVYVVGAEAGDLTAPQFWVDEEHLYFVRLLQPPGGQQSGILDIRFEEYEPVGEAWVAPRVEFFHNDTLVLLEKYHDIKVDQVLSDSLFDPVTWHTQSRWMAHR